MWALRTWHRPSDRSFVELNTLEQLGSLHKIPEVVEAKSRGDLYIHGIVYDPAKG